MFYLAHTSLKVLISNRLKQTFFSSLRTSSSNNNKNKNEDTERPFYSTVLESGKIHIKPTHKFLDSLKIKVTGGYGGNGYPKLDGLGGNGGNVYLVANDKVTLRGIRALKNFHEGFKAGNGYRSRHSSLIGEKGKDYEVRVPTGVSVIVNETNQTLAHLNNQGDKVVVAFGGRGGDRTNSFCGSVGQQVVIKLDLKLLADCGLVGFPNAGKSTLLRALSRASPRIASYPFTTITPNLGVIEYKPSTKTGLVPINGASEQADSSNEHYEEDHRSITVADLPGLIEGAHKNIGLGHRFLKHITRTKLLIFVVDIDGFRNAGGVNFHQDWTSQEPIQVIQSLVRELDLYDPSILQTKPSLLVITKLDDGAKRQQFNKVLKQIKNTNFLVPSKEEIRKELQTTNATETKEIEKKEEISDFQFDQVVGVSAVTQYNIDYLKGVIRKMIDANAETQKENISFKELMAKKNTDTECYYNVEEENKKFKNSLT